MNKIFILSLGIVLIFLFSFAAGYSLHEAKDQTEIHQEAEKIIINKQTIKLNITEMNFSICSDGLNNK